MKNIRTAFGYTPGVSGANRGRVLELVLLAGLLVLTGSAVLFHIYLVKNVAVERKEHLFALEIADNLLSEMEIRLREEPELLETMSEEEPLPVGGLLRKSRYLSAWEKRPLAEQDPLVKEPLAGFTSRFFVTALDTADGMGGSPGRLVTVEVSWPRGRVVMRSTVTPPSLGNWIVGEREGEHQ